MMNPITGSDRNYKVGPKNNWRRTVWNEILRRTNGREKTYPILYLCGPQDLDRLIATSKGVPNQNLIAVDRELRNVERVKGDGLPAIDADVTRVLKAWPLSKPVSAVSLDFCSGLEFSLLEFGITDALVRDCYHKSVVMVNMMRGRDPSSNDYRKISERYGVILSGLMRTGSPARFYNTLSCDPKNRAVSLAFWIAGVLVGPLLRLHSLPIDAFDEMYRRCMELMRPSFISYKSGHLVFDSVVFRPITLLDLQTESFGAYLPSDEVEKDISADVSIARRLNALLAVRTRRIARNGLVS
jgi:hypothetical protein